MRHLDVAPQTMQHEVVMKYSRDAKPSSEYEILFASKTSSLLQEYFDEIEHWHFQNQA